MWQRKNVMGPATTWQLDQMVFHNQSISAILLPNQFYIYTQVAVPALEQVALNIYLGPLYKGHLKLFLIPNAELLNCTSVQIRDICFVFFLNGERGRAGMHRAAFREQSCFGGLSITRTALTDRRIKGLFGTQFVYDHSGLRFSIWMCKRSQIYKMHILMNILTKHTHSISLIKKYFSRLTSNLNKRTSPTPPMTWNGVSAPAFTWSMMGSFLVACYITRVLHPWRSCAWKNAERRCCGPPP